MPETVYVIHWRYHDGSGSGVLRVHSDQQRAEEERDLLSFVGGDRIYEISEQPIYSALA